MKKMIYLDYAAATPVDERVLQAMLPFYSGQFHNPSAIYSAGVSVRKHIEAARSSMAEVLGARPSEVIFTAGGTEANNLAIHGVMRQFPEMHIVVSAIEHDSVLMPARYYDYSEAPVNSDGMIDIEALKTAITDHTVLVSIMYANNEIGTIQPLTQIAKLLKEIRHERMLQHNTLPLFFHTDACQAANYLHVYANMLGVDMMTINSGKIYGPKQSGALFVKSNLTLQPQILGGGQEYGVRSGTENVAGIIGFAAALQLTSNMREEETRRIERLQQLFINLLSQKMPQAKVNGNRNRLANNVHITIPGADNERLIFALDEMGIQCAAGSACSASKAESSHALKAVGLTDDEARASLRFTLGRGTEEAMIVQTIDTLIKLVAKVPTSRL